VHEILIDRETLERRVGALARQIRRDAGAGAPIHLVAVLKGAFVFLADLMRAMEGPVSCDFIAVSSYGAGLSTSGEVRLTMDLEAPLQGRDVLIVEDIVDTGLTLSYLREVLSARGPRSLRSVCLLSKPARRRVPVAVDYTGFQIEDRFVVGYGLDYDELYRNLPYIAVLDEHAAVPPEQVEAEPSVDAAADDSQPRPTRSDPAGT
jgi:hypoxanthine phosphoribosyltransferase